MQKKTLKTKNLTAVYDLFTDLEMAAEEGTPAMGLITGEAGLGKTTAAAWTFVKADGVLVTCEKVDTPTSILRKLGCELGVSPIHDSTKMMTAVQNEALRLGKPIFFDEVDFIAKKDRKTREEMLETIRGVYDRAQVPVLLIGYKHTPSVIKPMPQLRGRFGGSVALKPADMADVKLLASLVNVNICDDLLTELLRETSGNFRDLRTGLSRIEKYAETNDLDTIGLDQWPAGKDFYFKGL